MRGRARSLGLALLLLALAAASAWAYRRFAWSAPAEGLVWSRGGTTWALRTPRALAALLVVPWLVGFLARSLADLPRAQRALALLARVAFVAALGLALGGVARSTSDDRVCTVFLVDVSDSVPDAALADARSAIARSLAAKRPRDEARLVTFAARPRVEPLPPGSDAPALARHEGVAGARPGAGSDLAAALRLAEGLYPPGWLRHALLFSDGMETDGDLLAEAERASAAGVHLSTVAYRRPMPSDVAVRDLAAPAHVEVGRTFELRADVWATRPTRARARLLQGESLNALDGLRQLDLAAGANEVVFRSVVRVAGEVTYALALEPLEADANADNDRFVVTLDVPGRPAVLYVDGEPARATPLASGLERQGFDVDLRGPAAMPASIEELQRYDFLVLSDVPAEQVSAGAQELVERYLRELGGGLLFAGGPNGYGPGGWQHTTMERLLPVRMDAEHQKDTPEVALALVIDRSGSMTGLPLEMAKAAARATVDTLSPDDLVEIIAFDAQPTRYVKMQPARNRGRIDADVARILAGGGTEIFPALDAAYQDMSVTAARKKHVILLTDGRSPTQGVRELVQAMAAESITVTTVGLGAEVDDQLLGMIKDVGGGRYHKVPDPSSLPRVFTRETELVTRTQARLDPFPLRVAEPADFLRGVPLETAPLLGGYTQTTLKPAPAQAILVDADHGDPVLARWHVGLGWALAWTSDVKARWASQLVAWPAWPQLWGQLVREHMRARHHRELPMSAEIVGGELRASVDAFTADDRFDDGLVSRLTLTGPEPKGASRVVPLRQTAPGRYEARVVLDRFGAYRLRADHARLGADGRLVPSGVSFAHVSQPYPREYARFEPDVALLARAAAAASGRLDPDAAWAWEPAGEAIAHDEPLWPRAVEAALLLLVIDLLLRRVRLFDRGPTAMPTRPRA